MDSIKAKIKVRDLNFWYDKSQVLHQINLDFEDKKITSIIGPSGSSKSTLLRTLNRIFELQKNHRLEGKIMLNDDNILAKNYDIHQLRTKVGMVFQKPTPFPMSIFNNVSFGVKLLEKFNAASLSQRVEESLRKVALWDEVKDRLHKSAEGLSGGQQQRLCIARALAILPEVLLLDEPCSSLDPIATAKIESLLLELKQEYTIIIVTHNLQQAMRISDNTAYLLNGKLIEYDKTEVIFNKPNKQETLKYVKGEFG